MPTNKRKSADTNRGTEKPYIPPKVLLAAPISRHKEYVLGEWLQYILRFTYPNYEIYLVDNSTDGDFQSWVWAQGFCCGYCPPQGMLASQYVAKSQNMLRDYFLARDYDYFFSLECDNFPPLNILELMLSYKTDNINIPYFIKQGDQTRLGVQHSVVKYQGWCANKVLAPYDGAGDFDGNIKPYYAPSFGCSLFSRRLMEKVSYRVDHAAPGTFSDSYFHMDSNRVGIQPYVHMGILCEHRRFTWQFNSHLTKAA